LIWLLVLAALGAGGYFLWQNRTRVAERKPAQPVTLPSTTPVPPPPAAKPAPTVNSFEETPVPPARGANATTPSVEDTLTPKAKELIKQSETERTKQLTDNVRRLNDRLAHWVSDVPARERGEREAVTAKVQSGIRNSRVSAPAGSQYPPEVQRVLTQAADRQKQIDSEFTSRNSRYRDLYVAKLREKISLAEKTGQSRQAETLKRRLQTAGDLDTWIRSLGGAPVPEPTTPGNGALESIFGKPAE
jgi:cytoskeletal protein RodZ